VAPPPRARASWGASAGQQQRRKKKSVDVSSSCYETAMERERRVNKEIKDFEKPDASGSDISVKSISGEKFHFKGHLKGPSDTPYEGGSFVVDIVLPTEYPFMPPKMKFDTKVWHPNISSQTGAICLGAPPRSSLRAETPQRIV
jgi:ubiquitin-protein ligase